MMDYAFFYESNNGDRVYNASSFEHWLKKFFTSGVFTGDLQVTANDDMTVNVSPGYCNADGKVRFFNTDTTLSIETADASFGRVDTIIVERNDTERNVILKVIKGVPTASPVAIAPVRAGGIYQLVLAQVTVPAGAVKITQTNIKDVRENTKLCGIVVGTVKEIDVSHMRIQFDAICEECKCDFEKWFENIKNQLSEDAAGNLQLQIEGVHHVLHSDDLYSDQRNYVVGDYCIKDNILYRFSANKNAGEWDETRVTKSSVVDELNRKWESLGVISKDSSDKKIIFPMALSSFNELAIVCRMHPFPWMNMIIPNAKAGLHLASYQYSENYHQSIGIEVADRNVSVNSSWTTGNYNGTALDSSDVEIEVYYR